MSIPFIEAASATGAWYRPIRAVPTAAELVLGQFAQAHEVNLIVLDLGAGVSGADDAGAGDVVR